jgi:hypothetical protein
MPEAKKMQALALAAAHLCSAYEELVAEGYDGWRSEIKILIDIMDAEIEWLHGAETALAAPGADDIA